MKKLYILLIILISILLCDQKSFAQASSTSHTGLTGQWEGWNSFTAFDLDVRHNGNYAVKFYSDSVQRMIVDANGTGTGSGYIGIGNNFLNPTSRLHTTQGGHVTNWFQMTGNNTGQTATDGLRIGVLNPSGGPYDVEFRQQENAPVCPLLVFG